MNITRKFFLLCMLVAVILTSGRAAFAQSADEFYRGKTLTLIVSADAGTLTDTLVRQFASYYVKNIPGHPKAVVMNVTGAGGMVAAASLQTQQPNDGTVIGFLQRNNLYTPLLDPDMSSFDPRKVDWIGSLDKVNYVLTAMTRTGITSADDLFKKQLFIGATGFSSENRILPALLNEYAGTRMKIVPGYTGRGEVYLAMQRREVDGWASTVNGLEKGEPARMLSDGTMKVLLNLGWKSHANFPNVPNLSDYITQPEVKKLFDFFLTPFEAGRPIAVPKGVPKERVDTLRDAFDKTVSDAGFIEAMNKQGIPIDAIDGDAVNQVIKKLYNTPASVIDDAREARNPG